MFLLRIRNPRYISHNQNLYKPCKLENDTTMNNKNTLVGFVGMLVLALFLSVVSAAPTNYSVSPSDGILGFSNTDLSNDFTITVPGAVLDFTTGTPTSVTLTGESGSEAFSISGNFTSFNGSRTFTVSNSSTFDFSNFNLGKKYYTKFNVTSNEGEIQEMTLEFENNRFCSTSNDLSGDFEISDIALTNSAVFGDDDKWYPLSEIEVEVELKNSNNDDVDNAEISWALYDNDGNLLMDGEEDSVDVNGDDEETSTFTIKLDDNLEDLEDGEYTLYIKAEGEDEDNNDVCAEESESVNIVIENDFVVLDNLELETGTESASCGADVQISGEVWNIGSDDQDNVYVIVSNSELKIDKQFDIGDINSMDNEDALFSLLIPADAVAKHYNLKFEVYDEDDDLYENDDNDESIFYMDLNVQDGCTGSNATSGLVSVTGEVSDDAKAGKSLVVKAKITNTGSSLSSLTLNTAGYTGWAESVEIDQPVLVLAAGESKEVVLTFETKDDSAGEQSFNLEVLSAGKLLKTQSFEVTIEESSNAWTGFVDSVKGKLGSNWYLWAIGLLNVVLVVIIIVVAIKVARK